MRAPSIVALLLFVLATSSLAVTGQAPAAQAIDGLAGKVTVRRDARGIPYIEASDDADLYFAQGYVTAGDRLWQMDLLRRVARGRTAEIFGKATLEEDKRWRRFGFAKVADANFAGLSPELQKILENYSRGVNAYIASLDQNSLPVEFRILKYRPENWTPSDTILIGKILADALSSTWRSDMLRASLSALPKDKLDELSDPVTPYDVVLFGSDGKPQTKRRAALADVPDAETLAAADRDDDLRRSSLNRVGLYAEGLAASNNWVISGKRTADGRAILANDPHLPPNAPGIWYLTHLSTPAGRVSGVTIPGVPGIILGHNEFIAWGATNVGPDVQDVYLETFDSAGRYRTPTGWAETIKRREDIKVRTNPLKPDTESVAIDVLETRNGPVILEDGDKKYSLKWTALDPKNNEFGAFLGLDHARSWDEFRAALKTYGGPAQNFVYADVKGHIGWYAAGRIPLRRSGTGSVPYDGASADGDWAGAIPFEDLPNLYDPPSGFIATANQRTVGTSYKYFDIFARDAAMPWRARRIFDRLSEDRRFMMDDVRDIQYDVYNIPLAGLAKTILRLGAASDDTIAALRTWDGRMTADSKGALLANEIRGCLANAIAAENKPVPAAAIRERILYRAVEEGSARWLPPSFKNYTEFLRSCDASARSSLADPKNLGPDETKWTWGRVFVSRFPHPLAVAPLIGGQFSTPAVPIDGSGQTPDVGSSVSMRHIASPGNWDATRQVIPLGESGDPRSVHYKDQFDAWKNGTPAVFPFTKEAVEKAAVEIKVFTPK